jgi:hypothetical protein
MAITGRWTGQGQQGQRHPALESTEEVRPTAKRPRADTACTSSPTRPCSGSMSVPRWTSGAGTSSTEPSRRAGCERTWRQPAALTATRSRRTSVAASSERASQTERPSDWRSNSSDGSRQRATKGYKNLPGKPQPTRDRSGPSTGPRRGSRMACTATNHVRAAVGSRVSCCNECARLVRGRHRTRDRW